MTPADPSLIRTGRAMHAIGAAVMVAVAVVPYVAVGLPISSQNASFQRQIDKTTRLLEFEPIVKERHDKLAREVERHEQKRREVLERIPDAADEGQFLAQITGLAGSCDLKLHNYRPGKPEKKPTYSQIDIHLDAEGTYDEICRFLAGLEALPRFCRLAGLTVDRVDDAQAELKVGFTLRIFFASTPLQTASVRP
jgi:Tfp pilus assembly protein PilO